MDMTKTKLLVFKSLLCYQHQKAIHKSYSKAIKYFPAKKHKTDFQNNLRWSRKNRRGSTLCQTYCACHGPRIDITRLWTKNWKTMNPSTWTGITLTHFKYFYSTLSTGHQCTIICLVYLLIRLQLLQLKL